MGVDVSADARLDSRATLSPATPESDQYPDAPLSRLPNGFATLYGRAVDAGSDGASYIRERIFDNRYDYVEALLQMGADILISQNDVCIINGVERLRPARVSADNIRSGATVLLAALAADGESVIENVYQIDRGYEAVDELLEQALGADVTRIETQLTRRPVW